MQGLDRLGYGKELVDVSSCIPKRMVGVHLRRKTPPRRHLVSGGHKMDRPEAEGVDHKYIRSLKDRELATRSAFTWLMELEGAHQVASSLGQ